MRNPVGVYYQPTDGAIVFFGRRRNGKDLPGTRWLPIADPVQRAALEGAEDLERVVVDAGAIRPKTRDELAELTAEKLVAGDGDFFNDQRRTALLAAVVDVINSTRAGALDPVTLAELKAAYAANLNRLAGTTRGRGV